MFRPKGYHVPSGYIGFLVDGRRMFFVSEQEYLDYVSQEDSTDENAA